MAYVPGEDWYDEVLWDEVVPKYNEHDQHRLPLITMRQWML